jgi:hypothetical protein
MVRRRSTIWLSGGKLAIAFLAWDIRCRSEPALLTISPWPSFPSRHDRVQRRSCFGEMQNRYIQAQRRWLPLPLASADIASRRECSLECPHFSRLQLDCPLSLVLVPINWIIGGNRRIFDCRKTARCSCCPMPALRVSADIAGTDCPAISQNSAFLRCEGSICAALTG